MRSRCHRRSLRQRQASSICLVHLRLGLGNHCSSFTQRVAARCRGRRKGHSRSDRTVARQIWRLGHGLLQVRRRNHGGLSLRRHRHGRRALRLARRDPLLMFRSAARPAIGCSKRRSRRVVSKRPMRRTLFRKQFYRYPDSGLTPYEQHDHQRLHQHRLHK